MKPFINISLFLLLILFLSCSSNDNQPEENEEEQAEISIEERLQAIVDAKVSDGLKGVSVSIRVNGQEQWGLVGGFSSETETVTTNMKFGIASITKTVVAATILKLEEEELLSLDDTIGDWLMLESENIDDNITIFQLLNHLTGLKGYFQHPDIWTRVEGDLATPIPSEELVTYVGEPIFSVGERYEYSNSNYLILGLIIKAVSGQTVGEAMRARFWDPLGLANTYFGTDEDVVEPMAKP